MVTLEVRMQRQSREFNACSNRDSKHATTVTVEKTRCTCMKFPMLTLFTSWPSFCCKSGKPSGGTPWEPWPTPCVVAAVNVLQEMVATTVIDFCVHSVTFANRGDWLSRPMAIAFWRKRWLHFNEMSLHWLNLHCKKCSLSFYSYWLLTTTRTLWPLTFFQ